MTEQQQDKSPDHPRCIIIGSKLVYLAVIMLWLGILWLPSVLWFNRIFSIAFKG
jgi:hypothetical protein